jgi:hypothetical protein
MLEIFQPSYATREIKLTEVLQRFQGPFEAATKYFSEKMAMIGKPTMDFNEKTSMVKTMKTLARCRSWMRLTNSPLLEILLTRLIDDKKISMGIEMTDKEEELFFEKVISGNIFHRLLSSAEKIYAMFNMLPGISSHFKQSSNSMKTLTENGEDYNIFYQLLYVMNPVNLRLTGLLIGKLDPVYHAYIRCRECLEEYSNLSFDIRNPTYVGGPVEPSVPAGPSVVNLSFNIDEAMITLTALNVAKQVDKDYYTYHRKLESEVTHRADVVSVNDFKRLPLLQLACQIFVYSQHCEHILNSDSGYAKDLGYDKSFHCLAELLLESGKLNEYLVVTGIPVVEHSTVTQVEKLSNLIAQNVRYVIRSNILLVTTKALFVEFQDTEIPEDRVLRLVSKYHMVEAIRKRINLALRSGCIKNARSYSGIPKRQKSVKR